MGRPCRQRFWRRFDARSARDPHHPLQQVFHGRRHVAALAHVHGRGLDDGTAPGGEPVEARALWQQADGALHLDAEPEFHGGAGATLELRVFGRDAVLAHLAQAGFTQVRELNVPRLDCGYYWPPIYEPTPQCPPYLAYIIVAQRPLTP